MSLHDTFFRIVKNGKTHQNTPNLLICQKQTDNPKWLILPTYYFFLAIEHTQYKECENISRNPDKRVVIMLWTDNLSKDLPNYNKKIKSNIVLLPGNILRNKKLRKLIYNCQKSNQDFYGWLMKILEVYKCEKYGYQLHIL